MNNNWNNSQNIKITLLNQDKQIILNDNHNGRIIYIEDNECEILDKNYINDKNNKITWRHVYSFLDNNCIENIYQFLHRDIMKNVVFKIQPKINFYSHRYEMLRIVEEVYDCQYNHFDNQEEKRRKRDIVNKESWEFVEWDEVNILGESKCQFVRKNRKKLEKKYIEVEYRGVNSNCNFKKKNGQLCNKYATTQIKLHEDKYNSLIFNDRIECCGTHKNQYDKLNNNQKTSKIEEVFGNLDYRVRNGIMCKTC